MDNEIGPTAHLGFKATMTRSLGTPGTREWGNSWQEGGMEAGGVGDWFSFSVNSTERTDVTS